MADLDPKILQAIENKDPTALINHIMSGIPVNGLSDRMIGKGATKVKETALTYATRQNSLPLVKVLLDAGADPTKPDSKGNYPVTIAGYRGLEGFVPLFFIHGADLEAKTPGQTNTGLGWAARVGHEGAVLEFLQFGANVDTPCHKGRSALAWSVRFNKAAPDIPLMLLEYGADPNFQGEDGSTPLHCIAKNKDLHPEAVLALLDAGAKEMVNNDGKTPSQVARSEAIPNDAFLAEADRYNIYSPSRHLMSFPANPAAREEIYDAVGTRDMDKLRTTLSRFSFHMQATSDANDSPLFLAAEQKNRSALRLMSTLKLFERDHDHDGNSIVHRWIQTMDDRLAPDLATLKHLVRGYGANTLNNDGHTAIGVAAALGKFTAVATCLAQGATLSALGGGNYVAPIRDLVNPQPLPHNERKARAL